MEALPVVIIAAISFVSPYITAWFTNTQMASKTKNLIALGISALVAIGYVLLTGGFDEITGVEDIAAPIGMIYALQQLSYNFLLKKTATSVEASKGILPKVPTVETEAPDGSEVVIATTDEVKTDTGPDDEPFNKTPVKG